MLELLVGGLDFGQNAIGELMEEYEYIAEIGATDHGRFAVHVLVKREGFKQVAYLPEDFFAVLPIGESDFIRNLPDGLFSITTIEKL